LVACAAASAGCGIFASHSCTELALVCDETTITLQTPSDGWTAGAYTLALTMDGTPAQCTMPVPDPPPVSGVQGNCGLGANVTMQLRALQSCPPVVCNATACEGMSCTPIAGRFQMTLVLQGMPAQVGLSLSVDGNAVMSESIAPKSATTEPNGAGCGTCTNASATVSLAGG
jgi:hypothetical protein